MGRAHVKSRESPRPRKNRLAWRQLKAPSVSADLGWAVWPCGPNQGEPLVEHGTEPPRSRVFDRTQLSRKAEGAEEWNPLFAFCNKTTVNEPHKEVENCGRCREDLHSFDIGRDRMSRYLAVEFIAQHDDVFGFVRKDSLNGILVVPDLGFPRWSGAVKQSHVLGAASLAAFEVITDGRF